MKVTIISTSNAYSNPTSAEDHYSYLQLLPGMITDENSNGLQQGVEGSSTQSAWCQALLDLFTEAVRAKPNSFK